MVAKLGAGERTGRSEVMKIRFSRKALHDLKRLREFIAIKNPEAAQSVASQLVKRIKTLPDQPKKGVAVAGSPNDVIRDLQTGNYTVRYLTGSSEIFILRIWHQKENEKNSN